MHEPPSSDNPTDPEGTATFEADQLVLVKGGQRYTFRCHAGEERALMRHLRQLADDQQHPLGWFDAAVLCHQLGRRLSHRLEREQPAKEHT